MARIDSTGKKTRKITVTLPDGTVATRRSPRDYVAAVIALGPDYKAPREPRDTAYLAPTVWQVLGWSVSFDNARQRSRYEAKQVWGHADYYYEFAGKLRYDQVHVVATDLWLIDVDAAERTNNNNRP